MLGHVVSRLAQALVVMLVRAVFRRDLIEIGLQAVAGGQPPVHGRAPGLPSRPLMPRTRPLVVSLLAPERVERDWTRPYERHPAVTSVFKLVYENTKKYWAEYDMCEKLVDLEENFQLWRFRHVKTVERIIGYKRGTGGTGGDAGSSGRRALP